MSTLEVALSEDIDDDDDDDDDRAAEGSIVDNLPPNDATRMRNIRRRYIMRKAGIPHAVPFDDFDAWIMDDMDFLLDIVFEEDGSWSKAHSVAEAVRGTAKNVSEAMQTIPTELRQADALLGEALTKLKSLTRATRSNRHEMSRLWGQVGLFVDPDKNTSLAEARKRIRELEDDLKTLKTSADERSRVDQNNLATLRSEVGRLRQQNNHLQSKMDSLPPTYLQRLLAEEDKFPDWARVGVPVLMTTRNITGEITAVGAVEATIVTDFGHVTVNVTDFLREWRKNGD